MNNQIVNQMNHQSVDVVEDVFVDVTSLLSFFFRILVNIFYSSFRCLFSFFVIILSITSDLEIFFERFCWKNDSENLSCWKCHRNECHFRCDRFRLFTNHFIKWDCDFESQRRKKNLEWAIFFCERKLEWRRTTTFWCCFVVVVIWRFEIKWSKEFRFFCWFFCFVHWTESNDVHSNLMRILHSMCKIDFFLCSRREQHQLSTMRELKKRVCLDK